MSRRRRAEGEILSLDSFLNIVTIAVGGLILVALVTVLGVGDVSVTSGSTALAAPRPSAKRVIFQASGDRLYFLDEEGNGKRVVEAVEKHGGEGARTAESITTLLRDTDVGDETHRVLAEATPQGLAWAYDLRDDARGESTAELGREGSAFEAKLASMGQESFAYFVVHEDGFEVFRRAREMAAARGVAVGWHPVLEGAPVRLSRAGTLGRRVQ